jgi:hypothetical protein
VSDRGVNLGVDLGVDPVADQGIAVRRVLECRHGRTLGPAGR